jgi:hypothetical protein
MSTHTETPEQGMPQLPWRNRLQDRAYHLIYEKAAMKVQTVTPPTQSERQLVILGFLLGLFSILTSFFPIAGLPVAISGLVMGLSGRRVVALERMATWATYLAVVGLTLSFVNIAISVGIYLSFYLFPH